MPLSIIITERRPKRILVVSMLLVVVSATIMGGAVSVFAMVVSGDSSTFRLSSRFCPKLVAADANRSTIANVRFFMVSSCLNFP